MVELKLSISDAQFDQLTAELDPRDVPKAIAAGVNRTASTVRTHAARSIREQTGLKLLQRDVVSRIWIDPASPARLSAAVQISGKPLSLYKYFRTKQTPARQKPGGVNVTLFKGGAKLIPHAFIATMRSGHTGVYVRTVDAKHVKTSRVRLSGGPAIRYVWSELPIKEVMGPGIATIATEAPGLLAGELAAAGPILERNVASQMERFKAQRAGGGGES